MLESTRHDVPVELGLFYHVGPRDQSPVQAWLVVSALTTEHVTPKVEVY